GNLSRSTRRLCSAASRGGVIVDRSPPEDRIGESSPTGSAARSCCTAFACEITSRTISENFMGRPPLRRGGMDRVDHIARSLLLHRALLQKRPMPNREALDLFAAPKMAKLATPWPSWFVVLKHP